MDLNLFAFTIINLTDIIISNKLGFSPYTGDFVPVDVPSDLIGSEILEIGSPKLQERETGTASERAIEISYQQIAIRYKLKTGEIKTVVFEFNDGGIFLSE